MDEFWHRYLWRLIFLAPRSFFFGMPAAVILQESGWAPFQIPLRLLLKFTLVGCYLVLCAYETVLYYRQSKVIRELMLKLELSYKDIFEAIITFRLTKILPVKKWTRDWVKDQLRQKRESAHDT